MEFSVKACRLCFKSKEEMHICTRCKWTYYCDSICQAADWNDHKTYCKKNSKNPYKTSDIVIKGISNNEKFQQILYSIHYLNHKEMNEKAICVKISDRKEGGYFCDIIIESFKEFQMPSDIAEHITHQIDKIKTMNLVALLVYSDGGQEENVKVVPLILSYNRKFINKMVLQQIREAGTLPLQIVINSK